MPKKQKPKPPAAEERLDWPGIEPKQAAFLTAFVITGGRVGEAAKLAKIARCRHYAWLTHETYRTLFEQAKEQAADLLEDEAVRRANEGVLEPVFYQGEQCGSIRRYPDGLMQFLLRGAKPEKYNRERVEHSGPDGGPVEQSITVTFVKASDR